MQKYRTFLTKLGKEKIIAAEAASTHLAFKHIAVGDAADPPTEDLTKLRNEVWRGEIQRIQVDALDNHVLNVEAVIPSQDGGFMVRELGLFDTDGDLIAVGRAPDSYKPLVEDGAAKSLLIVFKIVIDNTSVVVLNVDDSVVLVTRKYLEHQLSLHTDRKDNPHGVTKAQVGLNNVANYAVATEAEAKDGTSNTKYMTPLRTNQLVGQIAGETAAGVQTNLNEHIADAENPHNVTKEQVGLGNVDNVKQASKEEFTTHTADKENPHGVTKSQVGLGSVLDYGVATQAEAEAGMSNAKYMTPLSTKQAITKQAATLVTTHVDDKTNPHNVTKAQVGLGKVQDYELATEADAESGITHQKYMTPLRTKQAITKQLDIHANDYVKHPGYARTTGTNTYSVKLTPAPSSLVDGMGVVFRVGSSATGKCRLNVNDLGAKDILTSDGRTVDDLVSGSVYSVRYNGSAFILQSKGGDQSPLDIFIDLKYKQNHVINKVNMKDKVAIVDGGDSYPKGKRTINLKGSVLKSHMHISAANRWYVTGTEIIQADHQGAMGYYTGSLHLTVITDYSGNELYRTSNILDGNFVGYNRETNSVYVFEHKSLDRKFIFRTYDGNGSLLAEHDHSVDGISFQISDNAVSHTTLHARSGDQLLCGILDRVGQGRVIGTILVNMKDMKSSIVTGGNEYDINRLNSIPMII